MVTKFSEEGKKPPKKAKKQKRLIALEMAESLEFLFILMLVEIFIHLVKK
jgi:hypothetical protein